MKTLTACKADILRGIILMSYQMILQLGKSIKSLFQKDVDVSSKIIKNQQFSVEQDQQIAIQSLTDSRNSFKKEKINVLPIDELTQRKEKHFPKNIFIPKANCIFCLKRKLPSKLSYKNDLTRGYTLKYPKGIFSKFISSTPFNIRRLE